MIKKGIFHTRRVRKNYLYKVYSIILSITGNPSQSQRDLAEKFECSRFLVKKTLKSKDLKAYTKKKFRNDQLMGNSKQFAAKGSSSNFSTEKINALLRTTNVLQKGFLTFARPSILLSVKKCQQQN